MLDDKQLQFEHHSLAMVGLFGTHRCNASVCNVSIDPSKNSALFAQ